MKIQHKLEDVPGLLLETDEIIKLTICIITHTYTRVVEADCCYFPGGVHDTDRVLIP